MGALVQGQGELPGRRRGAAPDAVDHPWDRADVAGGARPPPQLRREDRCGCSVAVSLFSSYLGLDMVPILRCLFVWLWIVGMQDGFVRVDGQVPELPGVGTGDLLQEEGEGDHLHVCAMRWHW